MLTKSSVFKSPIELIDLIKKDIKIDKGIVPLIGAGMSAASGIPAGIDYFAYLFYCLTKVLGTNQNEKQWDPSTLRWPDYLEMPFYKDFDKEKIEWCAKIMAEVSKQNYEIYLQAIGVVSDWRATLNLLSRLELKDEDGKGKRNIGLKQPDERVIDSFFVNLTKGKKPSSSHMLLAHLSDVLRIKTLLTTNFDSLIENAYQKLINPIAVFDVHLDARLPDADFVRAQRSIVKMHGGRYGLRADFSLDKAPSKDDVEQFVNYLSFYKSKDNRPKLQSQRNLLVMGISPSSKRVMDLMCHALSRLGDLKIYWVCYQEKDEIEILNKFIETINNLYINGDINNIYYEDGIKELYDNNKKINDSFFNEKAGRIRRNTLHEQLHITSSSDLTSFLMELYQTVFLSLPPAGIQFSSIWPFPAKPCNKQIGNYEEHKKNLLQKIEASNIEKNIIYIYGKNGISAMAADIFYEVTCKYCCLWFNLELIFSKLDFTYLLIEAIAKKTGNFGLVPAQFLPSKPESKYCPESVKNQFNRIAKYSKKRIVVFINYREVEYGKNAKKIESNTKQLVDLLKYLHNENIINIVLGHPEITDFYTTETIEIKGDIADRFKPKTLFSKIKLEYGSEDYLLRFLLSLSLVRNNSYLSLLLTWSFIKAPHPLISGDYLKDNDALRFEKAKEYLVLINEHNLFRSDENHFVYIPFVNRIKIQSKIKNLFKGNYYLIKAESHQGIADWYMKLYRSSDDLHAMSESIYHRHECFKASILIKSDSENQQRFLTTSLIEMEQAIKLSKNTIYTSFQTLTINNSLLSFIIDLSNTIDKINGGKIKNNIWLCYKLDQIKKMLLDIRIDFLIKIGNSSFERLNKAKIKKTTLYVGIKDIMQYKDDSINYNNLTETVSLIHKRQYSKTNDKIGEIYKNKEITWKDISLKYKSDNENKSQTETIREYVRKWIIKKIKKNFDLKENTGENYEYALIVAQDQMEFLIKLFRYHHRLKLLEAQLFRYLNEIDTKDNNCQNSDNKLKEAEILYICSTEMMRYIMNNDFLNHENAKLRTNTGIMLSWMKRHNEAYRRYNEAYGYLNFGIQPDSPHEFALIDLRRAETFISKIEQGLFNNSQEPEFIQIDLTLEQKVQFGYLYDAIASIDRAEFRIKGQSIDTWWHCWMLELQLNVCTKIKVLREQICNELGYKNKDKYDLFGHCRECEFCGIRFVKNLEKGLEIVGSDGLRLARYLYLTQKFSWDTQNMNLSKRFDKCMEIGMGQLEKMINNSDEIDNDICRYMVKVKNKFNNN
jgi:hypothetical protein